MSLDLKKVIAVEFYYTTCGVCHIPFYLPDSKYKKCLDSGTDFFCPNGHSLVFTDSELQKEIKRRKWAEENRDYYMRKANDEERSHRATKGHLTKVKKRVKEGVCPCCNRTFRQLSNHMKTKHPNYSKEGEI